MPCERYGAIIDLTVTKWWKEKVSRVRVNRFGLGGPNIMRNMRGNKSSFLQFHLRPAVKAAVSL